MPVRAFALVHHLLLAYEEELVLPLCSLFLHVIVADMLGGGLQLAVLLDKQRLPIEDVAELFAQVVGGIVVVESECVDDMQVHFSRFLIDGVDDAAALGIEVALVAEAAHGFEIADRRVEEVEKEKSDADRIFLQSHAEVTALIVKASHQIIVVFLPENLCVECFECFVETLLVELLRMVGLQPGLLTSMFQEVDEQGDSRSDRAYCTKL